MHLTFIMDISIYPIDPKNYKQFSITLSHFTSFEYVYFSSPWRLVLHIDSNGNESVTVQISDYGNYRIDINDVVF